MTAIRFEEPAPLPLRRVESLTAFAAALRGRPGHWALLGQYPTSNTARQTAYEIRRSMKTGFDCGGFEAEARTLFGEHRVYVRYAGGAQ
ncbi:hypothetical protein ACFWHW_03975 [Streptomyces pharetrae]|uniref:hypothetical protein n=1 Tax=Streptomyces pharetrae TaxID=291370 RepID=UPI00364FD113